jgi:hypothetical protein
MRIRSWLLWAVYLALQLAAAKAWATTEPTLGSLALSLGVFGLNVAVGVVVAEILASREYSLPVICLVFCVIIFTPFLLAPVMGPAWALQIWKAMESS